MKVGDWIDVKEDEGIEEIDVNVSVGIVDFGEVLDEDVLMCVEVGAVVMVDFKVGITGNEGITIKMLSVSPICTQPFFTL